MGPNPEEHFMGMEMLTSLRGSMYPFALAHYHLTKDVYLARRR
jgi:hypothetical protein